MKNSFFEYIKFSIKYPRFVFKKTRFAIPLVILNISLFEFWPSKLESLDTFLFVQREGVDFLVQWKTNFENEKKKSSLKWKYTYISIYIEKKEDPCSRSHQGGQGETFVGNERLPTPNILPYYYTLYTNLLCTARICCCGCCCSFKNICIFYFCNNNNNYERVATHTHGWRRRRDLGATRSAVQQQQQTRRN